MKISIVSINSQYIHQNNTPYILLAGVEHFYPCLYEDNQFNVLNSNINEHYWKTLNELLSEKSDIYAFSCYIWNIEYVKKLIDDAKKFNPECKIIVGGPQAYAERDYFVEISVDVVLVGNGEYIFGQAVDKLVKGEKIADKVIIANEKDYSFAKETDVHYRALEKYIENNDHEILYFETSRGCPYKCAYCMASLSNKVEYLDEAYIFKCIDLINKQKYRIIKVCDRTFNSNIERMHNILRYISNNNDSQKCWHFEVAVHLFNEETFEILANMPRACVQFEVGVQSFNPDVLAVVSRHIDIEKTVENLKRLIALDNAFIHVDLIAGLPGENLASFIDGFNRLHSFRPHEIQLGFLKVLGKTLMTDLAPQYEIVYLVNPPFQVLKTRDISFDELRLLAKVEEWVELLWNSGKFLGFVTFMLDNGYNANAFELYAKLVDRYYADTLQGKSIVSITEFLVKFAREELEPQNVAVAIEEIFKDICVTGHKSKFPTNVDMPEKSALNYREKVKLALEKLGIEKTDFDVKKYISFYDLPSGKICAVNRYAKDAISGRYDSVIF